MAGKPTPTAEARLVAQAFARIEGELLESMMRNFARHRAEELAEGFDWPQWQALQLRELDAYARRSALRYGPEFDRLNARIDAAVRDSWDRAGARAESRILAAVRAGWEPPSEPGMSSGFFHAPQQRLDALAGALHGDMIAAERAVLRRSADIYRDTVFAAQVYAASGAGTYERAIDMATRDFLGKGIDCVEYRNGSRHAISDYAAMAVRTGVKRAACAGEGAKREEWGVRTVIVAHNPQGCPDCQVWSGEVLVDDVYSGGTSAEAQKLGYALLSEAMDAGLLHPNCRDTLATWFPDLSPEPKTPSAASLAESGRREELEAAQTAAERTSARYGRLSRLSLDEGDRARYAAKAEEWGERAEAVGNKLLGPMKKRPPVSWDDPEAAACETAEAVKALIESRHGIEVQNGFAELSLEQQRATAAGLQHAIGKYGRAEASYLSSLGKGSSSAGKYYYETGRISISPDVPDAFVASVHEAIHAIDAEKSSHYKKFATTEGLRAYNLHSERVVAGAKRELGLRKGTDEYDRLLFQIFDNDVGLLRRHYDDPGEIAAYAIDHVEAGRGNRLSEAIARRF